VALIVGLGTVGSILSNLTAGIFMDRFGASRTMVFFFILSLPLYLALGWLVDLGSWTAVIIFTVTGYSMSCCLVGVNALATLIYPPRMRATGFAWASGMGRLGGMLGPIVGSALMTQSHPIMMVYTFIAIVQVLGAIVIYCVAFDGREDRPGSEIVERGPTISTASRA
jgi:AAHS family 4-hydroxybenzoate transporter-like MFS transporter